MLTEGKGQSTVVLITVALLAAFLAGAVAFSQVRLLPDEFEIRTNDLDPMTRAETRGQLAAGKFVPQAAWYNLNNITYNIGQEFGVRVSGDEYEGGWNDDSPEEIGQNYYDEVEERLQDQFEGYADDQLEYERCIVEIDPDIDVEYDIENPNPLISSANSDGIVTVRCQDNNLNATYKSDQSQYEIEMGNNRFPQFVDILGAGIFESDGGKKGVEQKADEMESDGDYDAPDGGLGPIGGDDTDGYWNDNIDGGNSCWNDKSDKSDAEDLAEQQVQNKIDNQVDNIAGELRKAGSNAMDDAEGGSKICVPLLGCSPELPGDINWKDIGTDSTVVDKSVQQEIDDPDTEKCNCEDWEDPSEQDNCQDWTWKADTEGRYYVEYVTVKIEVWEQRDEGWADNQNAFATSNEIIVDRDGDGEVEKVTIEVQDRIKHEFADPGEESHAPPSDFFN